MNSTICNLFWEMLNYINIVISYCIVSLKLLVLSVEIFFSKKYGKRLGAIASHKSASGLGLGASFGASKSTPRFAPNSGDATVPIYHDFANVELLFCPNLGRLVDYL